MLAHITQGPFNRYGWVATCFLQQCTCSKWSEMVHNDNICAQCQLPVQNDRYIQKDCFNLTWWNASITYHNIREILQWSHSQLDTAQRISGSLGFCSNIKTRLLQYKNQIKILHRITWLNSQRFTGCIFKSIRTIALLKDNKWNTSKTILLFF